MESLNFPVGHRAIHSNHELSLRSKDSQPLHTAKSPIKKPVTIPVIRRGRSRSKNANHDNNGNKYSNVILASADFPQTPSLSSKSSPIRPLPRKYTRPSIPRTPTNISEATPSIESEGKAAVIRLLLSEQELQFNQKSQDSASRTWCTPVTRDIQLQATRNFYNAMHDSETLDISHCVVCYQQRAPKQLMGYTWTEFEPFLLDIEEQIPVLDREHFSCVQCFPREASATFLVCSDCNDFLEKGKVPFPCRTNNLALGCTHRYPEALQRLSPFEERLISIYTPCGWITKLQIDIEKGTDGRYRKHKRGHITVFPSDVQGVASGVLPHPLVEEQERIHVCFVGPRKPLPSDFGFMLSVNPQNLKRALVWLKQNNPLYEHIAISDEHLATWSRHCPDTTIPEALLEDAASYEVHAQDEIRTGHYVPAAERGRAEGPVYTAEEVMANLEDREREAARLEDESNVRPGGIRAQDRGPDEMTPRHIDSEVAELVSTGLLATEAEGEYSPRERLQMLLDATMQGERRHRGRKPDERPGIRVVEDRLDPLIVHRRGEEFADSNDPDFFPKTFPCLFPWGRGGPKPLKQSGDGSEEQDPEAAIARQPTGYYLRPWVRLLLQRHGAHFATHPTFAFMAFNMLVRSENRRISYLRMNKASFGRVQKILKSLTPEALDAAEAEYRETRTTTNGEVASLLRELSVFGNRQHMSNEERLYSRRKIKALSLKYGMPSIWYTINPNDLTNEVNMKLAAFRVSDGQAAEELMQKFRKHIGTVQHVVRDPVSSAKFFHREMELFFQHYVAVGTQSVFGKVSAYFGNIETNERGALHLHGLIWLDANIELPHLFRDIAQPEAGTYKNQICEYIDSVFSECCDIQAAYRYKRYKTVYENVSDLMTDNETLDAVFEKEANWVASRVQIHSCTATCLKYSHERREKGNGCPLCRFNAPWPVRERTEFTSDGILRVRRNHNRVNRYCPAVNAGLRHNTDCTFLPTCSAGLSMAYYGTNYSTKLETPLWKRAALIKTVFGGQAGQDDEDDATAQPDTEKDAAKKNKTRQFMARLANLIYTSRELSAVEVCANLMGYGNNYSSEKNWINIHLNSLYWTVFHEWQGLRQAFGPEAELRAAPPTVGMNESGIRLSALEAYIHRGPLLREVCFYEYLTLVKIRKVRKTRKPSQKARSEDAKLIPFETSLQGHQWWTQELLLDREKQQVPVLTGYLDYNVHGTIDGFHKRSAVLLLALFVPWERFVSGTREPDEFWEQAHAALPGRIRNLVTNIQLLHKSAEDAKKDAKQWADRSEGDEGIEFDDPDEALDPNIEWRPEEADLRNTFHNAVSHLLDGTSVAKDSPRLGVLLESIDDAGFASPDILTNPGDPADDRHYRSLDREVPKRRTDLVMPKPVLKAVKAAQEKLHKDKIMAVEGDEEAAIRANTEAGAGFDDQDAGYVQPRPAAPHTWVDMAPGDTFLHASRAIGKARTLNRMQGIALGLVCEALDAAADDPSRQHLQYIGGGGGTGKSWLIDTLREVFAAKGASHQIVVTATSGTAAAGIGGTTIHSAVGMTFKDPDGATIEPVGSANLEKAKQRWRRRTTLVVDEVSMLGLGTLYEIDDKLRMLRGFADKPFGGLPVVIFSGDFLQFPPVQQRSLLSNVERISAAQAKARPTDRSLQRRWRDAEALKLWQGFTNVVMLEEQKRAQGDPFLLEFLERFRQGRQTADDASRLQARYDPASKFDFSGGRRAIIPLNRHRWDISLHAALAYGAETGRKVSIYLSGHQWQGRAPTEDEMIAAMLLGDEGQLPIPGLFPYIEGMPVIVNENQYMGLKVVNGAEFTAAGITHAPGLEEHVIHDTLSIFLGPPSGILLRSNDTQGISLPHLPADTILLHSKNIRLPAKYAKALCPHLASRKGFKLGVIRRGLACTPGFALTDYKAQGRTLGGTVLGLYSRKPGRPGKEPERCDPVSMYVQMSRARRFEDIRLIQPLRADHFLSARMPEELIQGVNRLRALARATAAAFEERQGYQGPIRQNGPRT